MSKLQDTQYRVFMILLNRLKNETNNETIKRLANSLSKELNESVLWKTIDNHIIDY